MWPAYTGGKSVGILPRSERYYVHLIASDEGRVLFVRRWQSGATGTCRILPNQYLR